MVCGNDYVSTKVKTGVQSYFSLYFHYNKVLLKVSPVVYISVTTDHSDGLSQGVREKGFGQSIGRGIHASRGTFSCSSIYFSKTTGLIGVNFTM